MRDDMESNEALVIVAKKEPAIVKRNECTGTGLLTYCHYGQVQQTDKSMRNTDQLDSVNGPNKWVPSRTTNPICTSVDVPEESALCCGKFPRGSKI